MYSLLYIIPTFFDLLIMNIIPFNILYIILALSTHPKQLVHHHACKHHIIIMDSRCQRLVVTCCFIKERSNKNVVCRSCLMKKSNYTNTTNIKIFIFHGILLSMIAQNCKYVNNKPFRKNFKVFYMDTLAIKA